MHAHQMISTHPDVRGSTNDVLIDCVEACFGCAQACVACADACLAEPMVEQLRQCIRLDLDCADICSAAGSMGSRRTGSNEAVLKMTLHVCAEACRTCAEECERHAEQHEHCRICGQTCRQCEQLCRAAGASITPQRH